MQVDTVEATEADNIVIEIGEEPPRKADSSKLVDKTHKVELSGDAA